MVSKGWSYFDCQKFLIQGAWTEISLCGKLRVATDIVSGYTIRESLL
jgi:hypothetical protein